jgi:CRISPR system Cascade subunit CasA
VTKPDDNEPSFNLWTEPWITLEGPGGLSRHGIRSALLHAHEHTAVYDPSPLVVVGIHRLLVAILQDSLHPADPASLEQLWQDGAFPAAEIDAFGERYVDRFDLFSPDKPFLQTADIPLRAETKEALTDSKSVAQLHPDIPSGTLVTHYRHGIEDEVVLSPAAAAAGLVTIPPFASTGGRGMLPSINGVPPIYVLPGGATLFEALTASLLSGEILAAPHLTGPDDLAWWKRPVPVIVSLSRKGAKVGMERQLTRVGLLHGLTFPARRVRLYPERLNAACSRSGVHSEWCVRRMAFSMGESRAADQPLWRDPFAAIRVPQKRSPGSRARPAGSTQEKPKPIRPFRGRASWREFSGLFLQQRDGTGVAQRPLFLEQLALLDLNERRPVLPFRCVSFQTDGKMKYYEWSDFGLDVPLPLLQNPPAAGVVRQALSFAERCGKELSRTFADSFKRDSKSPERFRHLKDRMQAEFWNALAGHFRQYVLRLGDSHQFAEPLRVWRDLTCQEAQASFNRAAEDTGDDGATLRRIELAKVACHNALLQLPIEEK